MLVQILMGSCFKSQILLKENVSIVDIVDVRHLVPDKRKQSYLKKK